MVTQDAATLRLEQRRLQSGETYDELGRRQGPLNSERESTTYRLTGRLSSLTVAASRCVPAFDETTGHTAPRCVSAPGVTFERSLSIDDRGRLVLEIVNQIRAAIRRRLRKRFSTSGESFSSVADAVAVQALAPPLREVNNCAFGKRRTVDTNAADASRTTSAPPVAKNKRSLECVVGAAAQRDVLDRRTTGGGKWLDMMELQECRLAAAAVCAGKGAATGITPPYLATDSRGNLS